MPSPTPRGIAVAALGLVPAVLVVLGVPGAAPAWAAFWLLLVVAALVDLLRLPPGRRLDLELEPPPLLTVGGRGELALHLSLPSRRPLATELLVEASEHLAPLPAVDLRVGAEGATATFALDARRRGEASLEEVWVRWQGPLGLVRRTERRRTAATVTVTPDLAAVGRQAVQHVSQQSSPPGQRIERYSGQGTEFHALREWATGLDRRAIDWKASGRHTRLLARELRAERNHQIVLALDTGRLMAEPLESAPGGAVAAGGSAALSRLDHAIHAALLLATASLRHGDRVGLYAFADRPGTFAPPRGGAGALPGLVRLAAGFTSSPAETNFTLGLTELSRRLRRRSLVVVLTDFVDSVTAGLMVDNLVRLAHRQLVLFVAFRDPLLDRLVATPPSRRVDLERAVVAGSLERERRQVLARLGREGVLVVDATPAELGPRLLDRYLEVKRREQI